MIYCCTREHIDTNMFNIVAADLHSTSSTGNVFTPGVSILCCGDASSPSTHVDYQHKKELPDHSRNRSGVGEDIQILTKCGLGQEQTGS